jgi:hypothetical protein
MHLQVFPAVFFLKRVQAQSITNILMSQDEVKRNEASGEGFLVCLHESQFGKEKEKGALVAEGTFFFLCLCLLLNYARALTFFAKFCLLAFFFARLAPDSAAGGERLIYRERQCEYSDKPCSVVGKDSTQHCIIWAHQLA